MNKFLYIILTLTCLTSDISANEWVWQKACEGKPANCEVWFNSPEKINIITGLVNNKQLNVEYRSYDHDSTMSATFIVLQNIGMDLSQNATLKQALSSYVDSSINTQKIGIIQSKESINNIASLGSSKDEILENITQINISQSENKTIPSVLAAIDYLGGNNSQRKLLLWMTSNINILDSEMQEIKSKLIDSNVRLVVVHLRLDELSSNSSSTLKTLADSSDGLFFSINKKEWFSKIKSLASYTNNGGKLFINTRSLCGNISINLKANTNNRSIKSRASLRYPACRRASSPKKETIAIIAKSKVNGEGGVGDTIDFTYSITNTGQTTLKNIKIKEELSGVTLTGESIARLSAGSSNNDAFTGKYIITQQDIDNGKVENQAKVTAKSTKGKIISDLSDESSLAEDDKTITPLSAPQIKKAGIAIIAKAFFSGLQKEGDNVNYTYTIKNTGQLPLTNISVQNSLDGVVVKGSPITSLAVGAIDVFKISGVYTIKQADIENGKIKNQATVSAKSPKGENITDLSDSVSLEKNEPTVLLIDKPYQSFWQKWMVPIVISLVAILSLLMYLLLRKKPVTNQVEPYAKVVEFQSGEEISHQIAMETVVLGRNKDCNIVLSDSSISGKHAVIKRQVDGTIILVDTMSVNKVLVNGEEIKETELKPGDIIQLGETKLRFEKGR